MNVTLPIQRGHTKLASRELNISWINFQNLLSSLFYYLKQQGASEAC